MKCDHWPLNATDSQVQDPNGDVILIGTEARSSRVIKAHDVGQLCLETNGTGLRVEDLGLAEKKGGL